MATNFMPKQLHIKYAFLEIKVSFTDILIRDCHTYLDHCRKKVEIHITPHYFLNFG
jgi:hypothetical protein